MKNLSQNDLFIAIQNDDAQTVQQCLDGNIPLNAPEGLNLTPLMTAILKENRVIIDLILTKMSPFNAFLDLDILEYIDNNHDCALHHACMLNDEETVARLLSYGVKADRVNHIDQTPLEIAVMNNNPRLIQLLANHSDLNRINKSGHFPLLTALRFEHLDAFKQLLAEDARVDMLFLHLANNATNDHYDSTSLFKVLYLSQREQQIRNLVTSISSLIMSQPDAETLITILTNELNILRQPPLTSKRIELLTDKFDRLNKIDQNSISDIIETMFADPYTLSETPNVWIIHDLSPLHLATQEGNLLLMQQLVAQDNPIDAIDKFGKTALVYAIEAGDIAAAVWLIQNGANPAKLDYNNNNILHYLALSNYVELIDKISLLLLSTEKAMAYVLLELRNHFNNEDVLSVNNFFKEIYNPLKTNFFSIAQLNGLIIQLQQLSSPINIDFLEQVFGSWYAENHLDPNQINIKNQTPLSNAIVFDNPDLLKSLMQFQIDLEQPNEVNNTPLVCAVNAGAEKLVEFFCENGVNINTRNHLELTALDCAIIANKRSLIRMLIGYGAIISVGL